MIFTRLVDDAHHPYVEWVSFKNTEEFLEYIAGETDFQKRVLHVRLSITHYKNTGPLLVNASNGLLLPEEIPEVVKMLQSAYYYHIRAMEEISAARET